MGSKKVYPEGLLGKKVGMTQVFTEDGTCVPVTVLELGPCFVLDVRSLSEHGYEAVRLGFEERDLSKLNKADTGNFAKSKKGAFRYTKEIRCSVEALGWGEVGKELSVADVFSEGDVVDISGKSLGRGFTGVVKRYRVAGQPATRGTHEYRRNIGSIGCRKSPGRVFKNKKMPGQWGNDRVTVQNLRVVAIKPEMNAILVKGAVPGKKGGLVEVKKAAKAYVQPLASEANEKAA